MSEQAKFENLLDSIRLQLLEAQLGFDVWSILTPTEENDTLRVLNAYIGFFYPTIDALRDRFLIKIANVMDAKRWRAPSFFRVISMIKQDQTLVPGLNLDTLKERIDNQKKVTGKVLQLRHKMAAHWELEANIPSVSVEEIRSLLEDLEKTYNDIHRSLHPSETQSFRVLEVSDARHLVNSLKQYLAMQAPAGLAVWTAVQDQQAPGMYLVPGAHLEKLKQALEQ